MNSKKKIRVNAGLNFYISCLIIGEIFRAKLVRLKKDECKINIAKMSGRRMGYHLQQRPTQTNNNLKCRKSEKKII